MFEISSYIAPCTSVLRRDSIDALSDAAVNVTQCESSQTSKGASCFHELRGGGFEERNE